MGKLQKVDAALPRLIAVLAVLAGLNYATPLFPCHRRVPSNDMYKIVKTSYFGF